MRKMCLSAVVIALLTAQAWGAVIFMDDFSSGAVSNLNWTGLFADDNGTLRFRNGVLEVVNQHTGYSALAIHTLPANLISFAFSFTESASNPGAGAYFCLREINGKMCGYAIQRGPAKTVVVNKVEPGNTVTLLSQRSEFMRETKNQFEICKKGDVFSVFCNGYYAGAFSDAVFSSGDIALVTPPSTTAYFDDVLVRDQLRDSLSPQCFRDGFADSVSFGWNSYGSGSGVRKSGYFGISCGKNQNLFCYVSLQPAIFRARLHVAHQQGSAASPYGLLLVGKSDTEQPLFFFAITADGSFFAGDEVLRDQSKSSDVIKGNPLNGGSQWSDRIDSLEISRSSYNGGFEFSVNGNQLLSDQMFGYTISGIGIFAQESLLLAVDSFCVIEPKCESPTMVRSTAAKAQWYADSYSATGRAVNLLGRTANNWHVSEIIIGRRNGLTKSRHMELRALPQ